MKEDSDNMGKLYSQIFPSCDLSSYRYPFQTAKNIDIEAIVSAQKCKPFKLSIDPDRLPKISQPDRIRKKHPILPIIVTS